MSRRSVGPWFRKSKNAWYVCHNGQQVNLEVKGEENEARAIKACHRLMGGDAPVKPEPKPTPPQMQDPVGESRRSQLWSRRSLLKQSSG